MTVNCRNALARNVRNTLSLNTWIRTDNSKRDHHTRIYPIISTIIYPIISTIIYPIISPPHRYRKHQFHFINFNLVLQFRLTPLGIFPSK